MKYLTFTILVALLATTASTQVNYLNLNWSQKISNTTGNFTAVLDNGDWFGNAIDTIGDLNNDGIIDLVVGTPGDDDGGSLNGSVYILFMDSAGTVKSHQKISDTQGGFTGTFYLGEYFGTDVACIGDHNGDGINDIAVGAEYDGDGSTWNGAVWILHLDTTGMVLSWNKISDTQGGFTGVLSSSAVFGSGVCSLGDLNGDNIPDLLVGSRRQSDGNSLNGAVWVLFMNANGTVNTFQKISQTAGNLNLTLDNDDSFGCSVENLGDINGDGITDIAVGAFKDDDGGTDRGAVYILMLDSNGMVLQKNKISSLDTAFSGVLDNDDRFGKYISRVPDLDNDGIPELLAGAHGDDDGGSNTGAVYILYLNNSGQLKYYQKISAAPGNFPGSLQSGSMLSRAAYYGDYNHTGVKALAIGALADNDGGPERGAVWILSDTASIPPLGIGPSEPSDICLGDSTLVQVLPSGGLPPYTYQWSPNLGSGPSYWVTPAQTTTYYVTVTDNSNQAQNTSILVTVSPRPTINLGPDTSVFLLDSLVIDAGPGFTQYWWSDSSTQQTLLIRGWDYGIDTLTIIVQVWDTTGCSNRDTIMIRIHDGNGLGSSYSENAIRIFPNPTGSQFYLDIPGIPAGTKVTLSLYDITGKLVFKEPLEYSLSIGIDPGPVPAGMYVVRLLAAKTVYQGVLVIE